MAATRYQYEALPDADSIRVFQLNPRPSSEAVLTGSLTLRRLYQKQPKYTSLSYSWGRNSDGDASMSKSLFLDGYEVSITENLHDFLSQLAEPDTADIPLLWIDAICIDQENTKERTRQVSIMANIYREASNLIIWLGYGTDKSEDFEAMEALELVQPVQHWLISKDQNIPEQLRASGKGGLCMPRFQAAIAKLCQRRYFQRRWVMQEIHNSKPDCTVLAWGAFRMTPFKFISFVTGMGYLVSKESIDGNWNGAGGEQEYNEESARIREVIQVLHLQQSYQPSARLRGSQRMLDCLFKFQDTACADDRDLIYSLLSFGSAHFSLAADYSMPSSDVYIAFARAVTEEGYVETLLSLASWQLQSGQRSDNTDELPSWCPDFRYHIRDQSKRGHLEPKKVAHYSKYDLPKPRVLSKERVLEIRAKIGRLLSREQRDTALEHEMEDLREGNYICQLAKRGNEKRFILRPVPVQPDRFVLIDSWKSKIADDSPYIWKNCQDVAVRTIRIA